MFTMHSNSVRKNAYPHVLDEVIKLRRGNARPSRPLHGRFGRATGRHWQQSCVRRATAAASAGGKVHRHTGSANGVLRRMLGTTAAKIASPMLAALTEAVR